MRLVNRSESALLSEGRPKAYKICSRFGGVEGCEAGEVAVGEPPNLERMNEDRTPPPVTLDEARQQLADAEAAWAARPWDRRLQRQLGEARARLAEIQRGAEQVGQLTLEDTPSE
jgi:hypothetical protein